MRERQRANWRTDSFCADHHSLIRFVRPRGREKPVLDGYKFIERDLTTSLFPLVVVCCLSPHSSPSGTPVHSPSLSLSEKVLWFWGREGWLYERAECRKTTCANFSVALSVRKIKTRRLLQSVQVWKGSSFKLCEPDWSKYSLDGACMAFRRSVRRKKLMKAESQIRNRGERKSSLAE